MSTGGSLLEQSDFALLESIRQHLLLDDIFDTVEASFPASFDYTAPPSYCRTSSFGGLFMADNWNGHLPFKADDSDDMVLYGALSDAVSSGWSPSYGADEVSLPTVKVETQEEVVNQAVKPVRITPKRRLPEPSSPSSSSSSETVSSKPKRRCGVESAVRTESDNESSQVNQFSCNSMLPNLP
ncbi:hypothetical protein FEM48_Zijuj08G0064500 [Ziziphus jujuba var. spinosa]|uniref:Uncharacterized protein n=1 Tax=Ziziphus jujuba var. spinosa TaxID=714518 RepID=A0A978UXH8_ZIZJJ|nr:hypothetical protein FEM48_Zijuj08G0064500 [Ziziphus jujuba var. spinosa]